ncbi:hypothetical protein RintRC_1653 [Richelia intracellularis]|nr:hypothetical protein RintRC_1653 [Richelia intracellularis]
MFIQATLDMADNFGIHGSNAPVAHTGNVSESKQYYPRTVLGDRY